MANDLAAIMPKILARGLMSLREQAIMPRVVNGDYSAEAAERGDTIDVPIPTAMGTRNVNPSNTPPAPTDRTPQKVQIQLNNWKQNDPFYLTDNELVKIDKDRHYIPMEVSEAVRALANDLNMSIHSEYKGVYGMVGTPGTTPFGTGVGVKSATAARALLNKQLCPRNNRRGVLDFDAEATALALSEFSDAEKIGSSGVKIEGEIGRKYGIDWMTDDHVVEHTAGTQDGNYDINDPGAALEVGDTVIPIDTGTGTILEGDIVTFAGHDQQYTVTADKSSGAGNLNISPGLVEVPADGANVTVADDHVVNLVFHRDAFAFATRPLVSNTMNMALGSQIVSLQDPQTGLVMRLEVSRQHKQVAWEFDILWGAKLVRPALAVRLAG